MREHPTEILIAWATEQIEKISDDGSLSHIMLRAYENVKAERDVLLDALQNIKSESLPAEGSDMGLLLYLIEKRAKEAL